LDLHRIESTPPSATSFEDFGRRLARLHQVGAQAFGAPPTGVRDARGYLADLPLPFGQWADFGTFYAEARVEPYVRMLADRDLLPEPTAVVFESFMAGLTDPSSGIAGPAEPVSRIHGDLWSGNVMWSPTAQGTPTTGWLIDPAAHGGHRETDLAMLALFGHHGLKQIVAGYQQVAPLAEGWRRRVPLHQVHPLLVHAVLFGGSYLAHAHSAAVAALRAD
jgi:fructosamine-3-kinase